VTSCSDVMLCSTDVNLLSALLKP